ncbi:putative dehydrogenase [Roseibium hamelinense]|uniref:Putative dehydrogenase n=1 Tax=Roseibium hamelinense TaxID=150831 RepID=A0A562T0X8_9HYPH|nr:Gfo/Idh/MocA family oxidoreductase [Roseibium hamelinense]MTI44622.1 Gfo/Idh/MocA family oxidoreductase [Roseibium hamelinense]TWI87249.1 putative dehydrogenase [Roseibium hamelinense]
MKLGFIGFGPQAKENIIPCCQLISGVEIAGICEKDAHRRRQAQERFRLDCGYSDYRQMIDDLHPDAVIAACYPDDHYEIARFCLDRSIPVFVEKPPAPSSRHLEELITLARRKRTTTGVGMNFRFAAVSTRLKALASGQLSSISLRHYCNKPTDPFWNYASTLRSFLHAQTIHSLDFLIDLCGPVDELAVFGGDEASVIDMTVMVTFANGQHASLITANTSPHFVFDFDAVCSDGRHISSSALWHMGVTEVGKVYANEEEKRWSEHWAPSPLDSGYQRSGYAGQMAEFLAAVEEGRESRISFASVAETYRCLDQIESQVAGRRYIPKPAMHSLTREAV